MQDIEECQIFADESGASLTHSSGWTLEFGIVKPPPRKNRDIIWYCAKLIFRYRGHESWVWETDRRTTEGQTDTLLANCALRYVARAESGLGLPNWEKVFFTFRHNL